MKRKLTFGLMLICAFALTNCSEQIVPPIIEDDQIVEEAPSTEIESEDAGIPFEVYATTAETKTAANGNGTDWSVRDSINVFHSYNGGFSNDGAFAIRDVAEGLFGGRLNQPLADGQSHNWYFIYPYSSSNTTPTSATVTIGASKDENGKYVQVQHEANSKEHLAGPNYPMWGSTSTEANTIPMMNVQHLSAIVALKIYNNGDGQDIKVKSAGLGVPEYKEYDDNNILIKTHPEEIIVGAFNKLNLTSSDFTLTPVNESSSNFARLELDTPITIPYGAYRTVYFAVKPFVAENRFVTVQVNGSDKPAKINANFVAGKITTIKVNINGLSLHDEDVNPQTSNILDMTSTGIKTTWGGASWEAVEDAQTLTYQPYSNPNLIINGNTPVSALVIGGESEPGIIKITGTAAELLPKVPVEFYVTSYNNKKAAMRVENIMAGFNFKLWFIPINMTLAFSYEALTTTDDGSTPIIADTTKLNFNGIVPVEQVDEYITILGEEPIHKKVASEQIENLLQKFDDNTTDGANPTFDGLKKAITSPDLIDTDNAAKTTADILYNKIRSKLVNKVGNDISDWLFGSNSKAFFQKVKDLPIEVTLTTFDPDGPEGDVYDPRITVWGINSPELVQNGN